ncbi:MAG: hypothetical protein AUI10_03935 [Actinobacteria bacterium 13_2_20CM_2_72_6]|nr:MAG: hypothetical protein AUI10_03935 [Actinobacteria bacterium 13_2_20CM_2_72_6]
MKHPTRISLVLVAVAVAVAPFTLPVPALAMTGPSPRPAPSCATVQTDQRAPGVRSQLPVLLLASGLNEPDDIQVTGNVVLVGQLGNGRIARLGVSTAVGGFDLLPAVVPTVEGLVQIGTTQFAANQGADRIVTVKGSTVTTFLQLRPVRGREGVDGIGRVGNTLVVPDSPRGRVLFVGLDGRIQRTVGGFARPVNAWPLPNGAVLIPDENAAMLVRINPDGTKTTLLRGLGLPDDVVTDSTGAIFLDSLTRNNVVQVVNGTAVELAGNLGQPQGLGADPADNLIVSEEDNGRLDAIVRTFKLRQALASAPRVAAGQDVCVALDRAPGFIGEVTIDPGNGYTVTAQPGTGSAGAIGFTGCTGLCRVQVTVHSGARTDAVWLQARVS